MNLPQPLTDRSGGKCELCSATDGLNVHPVAPRTEEADSIVLCLKCNSEITSESDLDVDHWRCLNEAMWSEVPAVKVLSYRLLDRLSAQDWAMDLKNMMYLEEELQEWAENTGDSKVIHKDANGHVLTAGDSVVLIKDLNVKGANFTAKRGTAVRRIRLVPDNANHIEGKVEGQQIVILTQYVKKS